MKRFSLLLCFALLTVAGCSRGQGSTPVAPDAKELRQAIALGAGYLTRACKSDGEFIYLDHLDSAVKYSASYNELRHAGALYSLGEYSLLYKDDPQMKAPVTKAQITKAQIKAAMVRGAKFFVKKYVAPITDTQGKALPGVLGAWSLPADENRFGDREVKLGGIGLGLVGLVETERVAPKTTSLETLRGLARGLLFLQEPDGSFYSKYNPRLGGKQDRWDSLYYPGESALGLAMLYEIDPDPKQRVKWLNAAFRALGYLATSRKGLTDLPADHWALIATAKLWPYHAASDGTVSRALLLDHAINLSKFLLRDPALHDARTTPVATRLEGLIAMLRVLPAEQNELRQEIIKASHQEIARLVACQIKSGELSGAIPRDFSAKPPTKNEGDDGTTMGTSEDEIDRRGEVRIDYIQHAISAMMDYDHLVLKKPLK